MKKMFKDFIDQFSWPAFIRMNIGLVIVTIGLHVFLFPSDLATGGLTGLSMVINQLIPAIPISVIMLTFNIILFILSFILIGGEFGGYTIYNSIALSGMISLAENFLPINGPIVDNIGLNLIYGIVIQAVGMAMVLNENASTGGTDIVAKILSVYLHIDIGNALFLSDFLIAIAAVWIFGLELGLYAFLGTVINSVVIDRVIAGFNPKIEMHIISKKQKEIQDFIASDIVRGVTLIKGEGGYSGQSFNIINTIVDRREYVIIKNEVREIDPNAFVWTASVTEVHGYFERR